MSFGYQTLGFGSFTSRGRPFGIIKTSSQANGNPISLNQVSYGSDVEEGDLLVTMCGDLDNGTRGAVPTGFTTAVRRISGTPWNASPPYTVVSTIFYKVMTASDVGGSFPSKPSGSSDANIGIFFIYRFPKPVTSVSVANVVSSASDGGALTNRTWNHVSSNNLNLQVCGRGANGGADQSMTTNQAAFPVTQTLAGIAPGNSSRATASMVQSNTGGTGSYTVPAVGFNGIAIFATLVVSG